MVVLPIKIIVSDCQRFGPLRPIPTRPICSWPTPIVGRFLSTNSRAIKILNMFDRESRPTITESAVQSADCTTESADCTADSGKIGAALDLFCEVN